MQYLNFHGMILEGAVLSEQSPAGFVCTGTEAFQPCYGYTGDQALTSLKTTFGILTDEDTVFADIYVLLAIGAVYKLLYFAVVICKIQWVRSVEPEHPLQKIGEV